MTLSNAVESEHRTITREKTKTGRQTSAKISLDKRKQSNIYNNEQIEEKKCQLSNKSTRCTIARRQKFFFLLSEFHSIIIEERVTIAVSKLFIISILQVCDIGTAKSIQRQQTDGKKAFVL